MADIEYLFMQLVSERWFILALSLMAYSAMPLIINDNVFSSLKLMHWT